MVTDQGFLKETRVVWETLNNIEGDSHFVDADFRTKVNDDVTPQTGALNVDAGNQIDTE